MGEHIFRIELRSIVTSSHMIRHYFPAVAEDPNLNMQLLWWLKVCCEIQF